MQVVIFDPKPSQDGEKDKKKKEEKKVKIFFWVGAGFELATLRLQILHLTR